MALNINRLTDLMNANKMSYQDLSDITHISKATLHRYFTGTTKKIPIQRLWTIAFALNTTPQYLMNDTDDPDPPYKTEPTDRLRQKAIETIRSLNEIELKSTMAFIKLLKTENE